MIALVFPGQGSQYVGMGKDLYQQSSIAREMFETADGILGFPLSRVCFEGPEEELRQTSNTQPAIFLHSVILCRLLPSLTPAMTAGHSLGEYSALVCAGALTFEDGLRIVRLRGELMQKAGKEQVGTMAAIVGLPPAEIERLCSEAGSAGIVQPANFNSPGQVVISGSMLGVRQAMELARGRGAKLVKELVVSGAFHSPLMDSAKNGLKDALSGLRLNDAKTPVYANVSATAVQKAEEIRTLLEAQLIRPVRWEESMNAMASSGASTFIEIGPGKVLQGLVKRTVPAATVLGADRFEDIQRLSTL